MTELRGSEATQAACTISASNFAEKTIGLVWLRRWYVVGHGAAGCWVLWAWLLTVPSLFIFMAAAAGWGGVLGNGYFFPV